MNRRYIHTFASVAVAASIAPAEAQTLQVLSVDDERSRISVARLANDASCGASHYAAPLDLDDAVIRAICAHPRARRAWAETRAHGADLQMANAAYLPRLDAMTRAQDEARTTAQNADGQRSSQQSRSASTAHGMLDMSWVLFDFGKRGAARKRASALLAAANAAQDETLQAVLFNAAAAFYAVRDAQASLDAAKRATTIASESLEQATAKHVSGVGSLADVLQARTCFRRAMLEYVEAESRVQMTIGALAVAIGLDANTVLQLTTEHRDPSSDDDSAHINDANVAQLIAEAKVHRPGLMAVRARLEAARANVDIARSQYRPTISLVGNLFHTTPLSQRQSTATSGGGMVGVQMTIPLFAGFAARYSVQRAQAHADADKEALRDAELQVSLDVWNSYHSVRSIAANLANSLHLLNDAEHALRLARGRYKEGMGTFAELLSAQTALGDAHRQRLRTISKWRTTRLQLAASLGRLGLPMPAE